LRGALHALRVEPADWFLADLLPTAGAAPLRQAGEEAPRGSAGAASGEPQTGSSPKRRPQILVAAGNPANRRVLGSILARAGHIVHFAEHVDEARQGLETR